MMAATKFTPGPWRMVGTTANRFVVTASGTVIAETWKDFRQEADARLIAAAPELYAVLLELADVYENCGQDPESIGRRLDAFDAARDVLAKARGEA